MTLRSLSLLLSLLLLPGVLPAQRPQGLGRELRAVTGTQGYLIAIDEDDALLRSSDQGLSFSVIASPNDLQLNALAAQGTVLIAAGESGQMFRTPDVTAPTPVFTQLRDLPHYLGDLHAIAVNPDGQWVAAGDDGILQSTDGTVWTHHASPKDLVDVVWSGTHWVAVGKAVYRSVNGTVWTAIANPPANLTAVAADGSGNLLATGFDGHLYRSTDHGATFSMIPDFSWEGSLRSVIALGDDAWWVGGDEAAILSVEGTDVTVVLEDLGALNVSYGLFALNGAVGIAGVETVAPPVISAPGSPSALPVEVTLTANADDDEIRFTRDGSDPSTGDLYIQPFFVTGTQTISAVSTRNGLFSPPVSAEIQGGDPQPFSLSISLSGTSLLITQDSSTVGLPYRLEVATSLLLQDWTPVQSPQTGTGAALQWTLTPIPAASPRFYRSILAP
ncbi:MAG: chitobiase/beta-hexosaminidase C-terminal domain-containing protein [Limnospira sp. PMC 1256.20]|uniref:chitobiase/beta-hexosaminidase C-terminal domain-containing protein n=1 Tax=Limnospira sp. PMC 1256.20 TaxID=2981054 RepID=UPI0028E12F32|nr:chitobiase/beta-hexosaminidase C-terminal domain-containing protein [Limnospira sp. PMC 1256.20]MDT9212172.1 chitobiase/beta-hexosaminidase C-terminal domain-containing protein [Limnospira sp. PMC 1256.20]